MKYVECLDCGKAHYVVTKKEADALEKEGYLIEEFNNRSMTHCSNCGSENNFAEISEDYLESNSDGSMIQPVFIKPSGVVEKPPCVVESKK